MKQTQMHVCIHEELILEEFWMHFCTRTEMLNGNYTGIYTIATMDEKCS